MTTEREAIEQVEAELRRRKAQMRTVGVILLPRPAPKPVPPPEFWLRRQPTLFPSHWHLRRARSGDYIRRFHPGSPAKDREHGAPHREIRSGSRVQCGLATHCGVCRSARGVPEVCPSVSKGEEVHALVERAKPEELPDLAAELARGLASVLARTATLASPKPVPAAVDARDMLLSVSDAATRLGVPKSWLYRHAKTLPFARKLGHRTLRFEAHGLDRWARSRPPA